MYERIRLLLKKPRNMRKYIKSNSKILWKVEASWNGTFSRIETTQI